MGSLLVLADGTPQPSRVSECADVCIFFFEVFETDRFVCCVSFVAFRLLCFPCPVTDRLDPFFPIVDPPLPTKRSAEAVLSEGNVEPYLPNEWTEEEASVLAHLVGLYGPTNWAIIAAGVATKSETQVRAEGRSDPAPTPRSFFRRPS